MDYLRDQSINQDSPSKQSYVGNFHMPPEKLSRPLYMNTVTHPVDRKSSSVQEISPQLYRTVPDAGSRSVIAALKTLQEKMRRLELERVQAEKNVQHFSQAAQHKADLSAWREQKNITRENDSTQRKELVSKLRSAETRCSLLEKQLDYMRKMVECADTDRITQTGRQETMCKESTHTDIQIQAQLNKLEKLEKEYLKLTSTQSIAERKIELLEQKLLEEEHERKLVQEKAEELQRELENNLFSLSATTQPKGKKKKKKDKASCKSTSPSHSVNVNVQSVLHIMKHRNPRLCERVSALQKLGSENHQAQHRPPSSLSKAASALGSISEILLALQDELGQMSFEHQELVRQIDETAKRELREDLERELDSLVKKMEDKVAQISKLRKHQQTVQILSQPSSSPKQKLLRTASVEGNTSAQTGVQALPPSPVKASPNKSQKQTRANQEHLRFLRERQRLCSSLRRKDITWET
ncbi:centrosomal protein cep57l1-like isoform X3 [Myxocyprinus asiaticus]|uniref:centrosomal protein cep57l1-like isoform X3 n=1 Tax=Myxocyprinus asiaticus TaxID=70543 RepID=UPI002222A237|nr:centrosomal protein cep57l1-like isoform X3 [Myxocyprinus asiaticus]